jgi:hypothetical protein
MRGGLNLLYGYNCQGHKLCGRPITGGKRPKTSMITDFSIFIDMLYKFAVFNFYRCQGEIDNQLFSRIKYVS